MPPSTASQHDLLARPMWLANRSWGLLSSKNGRKRRITQPCSQVRVSAVDVNSRHSLFSQYSQLQRELATNAACAAFGTDLRLQDSPGGKCTYAIGLGENVKSDGKRF